MLVKGRVRNCCRFAGNAVGSWPNHKNKSTGEWSDAKAARQLANSICNFCTGAGGFAKEVPKRLSCWIEQTI